MNHKQCRTRRVAARMDEATRAETRLKIPIPVTGHETNEPRQKNCSKDGNQDRIYQASLAPEAEGTHHETTDQRANDSDDDVHQGAVPIALHDLSCNEACDKTYD